MRHDMRVMLMGEEVAQYNGAIRRVLRWWETASERRERFARRMHDRRAFVNGGKTVGNIGNPIWQFFDLAKLHAKMLRRPASNSMRPVQDRQRRIQRHHRAWRVR